MSLDPHRIFADHLLAERATAPASVATLQGHGADQRFDVYRNNVRSALAASLAARFPAAERVTGEPFFRAMALAFALAHPPRSPLLLDYGHDFPDFVESFEPAAGLPYLADLMRLEVLRGRAYHARDAAPLDPARLADCPADRVDALRFRLHPSTGLLRSAHPVLTIWAMNSGARALAPIRDWAGEDVLVVRPRLELRLHLLPAGGAAFLQALGAGATLAAAVEAALADHPDFDLQQSFAAALASGVLTDAEEGFAP